MSRKKRIYHVATVQKYEPLFHIDYVSKLINCLMLEGKKGVAEKIVYDALYLLKKETSQEPTTILLNALNNIMPIVHVVSIRIAGSNYQVPVEISPRRQFMYAIKWLIEHARKRQEKTMPERLYKEIFDAAKNTGKSVEKKQTIHKMAEANRAYAHYRW